MRGLLLTQGVRESIGDSKREAGEGNVPSREEEAQSRSSRWFVRTVTEQSRSTGRLLSGEGGGTTGVDGLEDGA